MYAGTMDSGFAPSARPGMTRWLPLLLDLLHHLARLVDGGVGRRHAGVDGELQDQLLDQVGRHLAFGEGRAQVQAILLPAAERHGGGEHDQAARGVVEAGPGPDLAPGVAGNEVEEFLVERRLVLDRAVDPLVTQYLAALFHAGGVAFQFVHDSVLPQKLLDGVVVGRGLLEVGEVGGVEHHELRVLDAAGDELATLRRRRRVALAGDHQRRCLELGNAGALVHVAQRSTAAGVAGGRRGEQHLAHAGDHGRLAFAEFRGEPALEHGVHHLLHAVLEHGLDAAVPQLSIADLGAGVGKHELAEAVAGVAAEPHAGAAAHGEADEVGLLDAEVVEDREHVAAETVERVGVLGRVGFAVAALVVADDAEMLGKGLRLVVPHVQVGAERVGEHHRGRAFGALGSAREISGIAASTSTSGRFSLSARLAAAPINSCAAERPILAASAICTSSAMIRPSVKPRFARIFALSTSSPSAISARRASATEARRMSSGSAIHSACQAPPARSCSCTSAANTSATRPGASVAAVRICAAPTGLRLCGRVEEPPLPGAAGSNTSCTSVCASSVTSRAILPAEPMAMPSAAAKPAIRSWALCQGASGSERASAPARRRATAGPLLPSAASVPTAPPNWITAALSAASARRRRARPSMAA